MLNTVGIAGIKDLFVAQGQVFAQFDNAIANKVSSVSIGGASAPFAPTDNALAQGMDILRKVQLDTNDINQKVTSDPAEITPGSLFAVWVNRLTDWALSGRQTVQIMFADQTTPVRLSFTEPLRVKNADDNIFFETRLAQHRANAVLEVSFFNEETDQTTVEEVAFDPAFIGGISHNGYQHVRLPLPKGFKTGSISVAISYQGYMPDSSGVEPFVFLADTRLSPDQHSNVQSLVEPLSLSSDWAEDESGVWMMAPFPVYPSPQDVVTLKVGRQKEPILTVPAPQLTLEDDNGHTLVFSSDRKLDLLLCIDSEPVERLIFGTHSNVLRIPPRYLNGAVHHVALKDQSGSFLYWETQALLPSVITPADVMQRETPGPYPSMLFAQTPRRYEGLKAALAASDKTTNTAQIAYALSVLEGGYDNVKLKPLSFPRPKSPDVSIIIPAHNKVEVTYLALCSLLVAHNEASFEVIVVDDASTDETAQLEKIVSGITVLHNANAQRFIRACNRGADAAKGKYIALLNNDVEVTVGWLDELIAAFDRFDDVGLVGSKLLYPDGDLQDAGGIIWRSGNPWNYGNRQNPDDPRFCYARQADYLSGAAMLVPADLWHELGGLSSYMEPMYFEDTDFAFKVRQAGYTTWFIPSSVVYHYEGMTSGTDVTTGFKKFQEVNRPKFKRRWAKAYAGFGKEGHRPDLEKDRGIVGRVLFIDYTTPRPDQDAGSYAALQEIRLVQSLGYKVTFLPANMAHLGKYTDDLQKMGVEVITAPFFLTMAEYLGKHAVDFDAFYVTRYYVAEAVIEQLRGFAPNARVIFNNADLHFLREIRAAQAEGDPKRLEQARETREKEVRIINEVDVVLSYNEVEHSVIQAYSEGQATVVKCPWVVDVIAAPAPLDKRAGLSFLGSYRHHPNAEGVQWFLTDVMPIVNAKAGDQKLSLYGAGMTDDIKALKSDQVDPVGFVDDIADAFDQHRIFIAPLRSGAGIKGKVLSALAHGIPCVLTPVAAESIGLRSGYDCFIARTPEEWADAIRKLSTDDALWHSISEKARNHIAENFSFDHGRMAMREAFEAAGIFLSNDV